MYLLCTLSFVLVRKIVQLITHLTCLIYRNNITNAHNYLRRCAAVSLIAPAHLMILLTMFTYLTFL